MNVLDLVKKWGKLINLVVNTILLSLVYILGVGITSLIAKLFRKKFLDVELNIIEEGKESYWQTIQYTDETLKDHYRQF